MVAHETHGRAHATHGHMPPRRPESHHSSADPARPPASVPSDHLTPPNPATTDRDRRDEASVASGAETSPGSTVLPTPHFLRYLEADTNSAPRPETLEVHEHIGTGSFGRAFTASLGPKQVAVKQMSVQGEIQQREVEIMQIGCDLLDFTVSELQGMPEKAKPKGKGTGLCEIPSLVSTASAMCPCSYSAFAPAPPVTPVVPLACQGAANRGRSVIQAAALLLSGDPSE